MVDSDSKPLLDPSSCDEDEEEKEKETYDFKKMVFFHGKELAGKSFVRSPQQNLVKIGIGKNGVYKLDGKSPKVLAHWTFREIRDSSYSGYSFSLQLQGGRDYYVRTDDGESICMYIDLFRKDPDRALEQALNNPPMSNIPESGILTLRRKFSSEQHSSANNDVKFYTLNRRTAKNMGSSDPISKHPHNIEVDKRLRPNSIGSREEVSKKIDALENRPRGRSMDVRPMSAQDNKEARSLQSSLESSGEGGHVNGVRGREESKKTKARQALSQAFEKDNEKRHSNGIIISPVSTKGEVTTTESTKTTASPSTGSPINSRKTGQTSSKPVQQETKPSKSRDPLPSDSSSTSNDTAPLIRPTSSASSGLFSPTDEFQFVSGTEADIKTSESLSLTGRTSAESDEGYDRLENYNPDTEQDDVISLPESTSTIGSSQPRILISRDERERSQGAESLRISTSPESNCSGEYDHLPPLKHTLSHDRKTTPSKLKMSTQLELLPSPLDLTSPRRNYSQPALSTPASARESPCDLTPPNDIIFEESSEEEETAETPTNIKEGVSEARFEGVILRRKHLDPFADLLGSTNSRLRWSQELNPLYDYIKGYKISEGVRLYDSPSKLLESTKASDILGQGRSSLSGGDNESSHHKPPSIIVEEELENSSLSSREQTCSPPNEDVGMNSERLTEATATLPRARRPAHNYEEVIEFNAPLAKKLDTSQSATDLIGQMKRAAELKKMEPKSSTLGPAYQTPVQRRFRSLEKAGVSPRLGKRQLQQQRRSKTLNSVDDTATVTRKQRPMRAADALKDFSFVMREYRTFFVKLPTGVLHQEIFCVNKPISELREKLCDVMGADSPEHYQLYVEGACLSTLRECEAGAELSSANRVNRSGSLTHLVDSQALPDQGTEPILLKANLSLRMQGVTTSRILALLADDEATDSVLTPFEPLHDNEDFHQRWMSIVQGNTPCTLEEAIPLAALQYQAYFLGRTAVHSVVGFCRPTEFLPVEYAGIRGVEHRMYKIQEKLRNKSHKEIEEEYITKYTKLQTADTVFFPAREPRKKVFQSTKLKPILLGINKYGILRVDSKSKEVLDFWEFQVLKNWAYSKRTFVLAFTNKTYPVESNQAKWISELIDFHVDSIAATTEGTDL